MMALGHDARSTLPDFGATKIVVSLHSYAEALTPISQNVTTFGDKAFKEVLS